ncbi:hypothetical protein BHE74_00050314 [Ensete ventricosum]|nr:hypothetical protein GW17_00015750 [Ensete ventricosum]RWW43966.1 hypothetical protein BHE74_00050314 [Ensete ventricosum]RZS06160.1 hypothetical protein BHM03_00036776 [Ensete ventricosum]
MGCAHSTFGDDDGGGGDGSCMGAIDGRPPLPARELVNAGSSGEKVAWSSTSLVFSAAGVIRRGRWRRQRKRGDVENKSWLLAEARAEAEAVADPGSVHSSFRFSFGSQTEAEETMENAATPTATAVLLLVSLEDEGDRLGNGDARSNKRRQWQGLEVLERSISSAAADLVRFSYSEILSATRGFSKGTNLSLPSLDCSLACLHRVGHKCSPANSRKGARHGRPQSGVQGKNWGKKKGSGDKAGRGAGSRQCKGLLQGADDSNLSPQPLCRPFARVLY